MHLSCWIHIHMAMKVGNFNFKNFWKCQKMLTYHLHWFQRREGYRPNKFYIVNLCPVCTYRIFLGWINAGLYMYNLFSYHGAPFTVSNPYAIYVFERHRKCNGIGLRVYQSVQLHKSVLASWFSFSLLNEEKRSGNTSNYCQSVKRKSSFIHEYVTNV